MPMDYDDNDISHRNLHVAGEGRSKSSSVLIPFDFPKFDLDDSIQAHLRFDNLVETEVFLGIQSQEDNRWIEDFSRGSNGMEFNTTSTNSCSIPKRNNVWSEATSSESVEMLLKSVGQEETMPGDSIIPESNACNDQSTLPKRACNENFATSNRTLLQDKFLITHSASKGYVDKQLLETEESLVNPGSVNAVCVKGEGGTSTSEENHPNCDNLKDLRAFGEKLVDFESQEDPSHFAGVVDNASSNHGMLSTVEMLEQVNANISHKSSNDDGLGKHICCGTGQEKILEGTIGIHVNPVDKSLGSAAESGGVSCQDADEANRYCVEETADKASNEGSELPSSEGDDKNMSLEKSVQTSKQEVKILPINSDKTGSFEGWRDGSATVSTEQHSAELASLSAGQCVTPDPKMDSSVLWTCTQDIDEMEEVQGSPSKSESTYKKVIVENTKCVDMLNTSKSSEMVVLSSAAESSIVDNKEKESVGACHGDSVISVEKPSADVPTPVLGTSGEGMKESSARRQVYCPESEGDICKTKEDKSLPSDAGNVDPENVEALTSDQRTQTLEVGVGVEENDVTPCANSTEQDDETEKVERKPAVIGLSRPVNGHGEADINEASDVNEVVNVAMIDVTVATAAARTPLSKMTAASPQTAEKSNEICSSGSASKEALKSLHSNQLQPDKSSLKESVKDDLVSAINHEVTMLEGEKESAQAAEVDKASCGSPTIISSSEPVQMEKGNEEEIRGSEAGDQFGKIQSISGGSQISDAVGGDTTFTFKVNVLPDTTERESGRTLSPFPNVEICDSSVVVKETKLTGEGRTARTPTKRTPQQGVPVSDGEHLHGLSKGSSERKGRRASAKGMSKENAKKGNQSRVTNQESAKEDKVSNTFLSTSSSGTHVHGKAKSYKHIEESNTKLSGTAAVPDLNNSALDNSNSPSATFRQPFTDVQQVQLRGQIFVYGSLIQGTSPDEASMVSAFGISGNRSCWEPVWRASLERIRSKKCNSNASETPVHPPSVARVSDTAVKQGQHLSKVLSSPVAQASSKGTSTAVVNPLIPLSSPLQSTSAPLHDNIPSSGTHKGSVIYYQNAVTPLHPYQSPPMRTFVGHASWPSPSSFPSQRLTSPPTSTFNSSVCYQPVTMLEKVQSVPVKDTSGQLISRMKPVTSNPAVQTVRSSPMYVGVPLQPDRKGISSAEGHSVDSKPRKRKKVQASDRGQVSSLPEAPIELADSNKATILPSSAVPASVSSASTSPASNLILSKAAAAACCADDHKSGELDVGKVITCLEEMPSKVAEAQSQAEDAASLAATAVSHSEDLWRQMSKQKESGLTLEVEAKLASAAVAIAAAASVAKAAAAAAKVACNVALQAQLMADVAFLPGKKSGLVPSGGKYSTDVHNIGTATQASVLKGDNIANQSNSVLLAAKEAAKGRIEAASVASKQAENLDAIVKAAELAAAAVSQAGKIVAMGEPLPLSDLMEAGPESYWRSTQPTSELAEKPRDSDKELSGASGMNESAETFVKGSREDSAHGGAKTVCHGKVHLRERSNDTLINDIAHSIHTGENGVRSGKDCKASCDVVAELDPFPGAGGIENDHDELVDALPEDSIKEGSAVEVFKHGDGPKSAWYCASVMRLEDGKAYVCYTDLPSNEGPRNLCEWVPVEGEGDKAPIIRAAHPSTALLYQGTRKRRRAALGDYAWCIGDKVDVWIDDCWWEGVVIERNEKDETTLKVHFPAQCETSTVRAWNLRTSRSWNDGKWVEWSSSKGHDASEQSDTPEEKRQKLGGPAGPTKGRNKLANEVDSACGKPEKLKLLDLPTSDRIFDVGKTTKEDKLAARRPFRTGQQKEGSRVVFGVPKPTGKKRKFMEVSKHFAANRSDKTSETTDSVKFAKYLMPQATAARWKVPLRNDTNEKQTVESRSRVPSSRKSNRTLPQRHNLNSTSAQVDGTLRDHGKGTKSSVGYEEEKSEMVEHSCLASEEATEAPLSSLIPQSRSTSSRKTSVSNSKSERLNKGKLAPSVGKLSKSVEDKVHAGNAVKSVPGDAEPRRSNRRIQPTHRLLEGLQSSVIIPKMPSVSHDKGQKNSRRNMSTRGK